MSFTFFNSMGSEAANGTPFGYCALALELLAYAGQMVYLPRLSKKYGTLSLTAMYYTIASFATAITLGLRERDQLGSVRLLSPCAVLASPLEPVGVFVCERALSVVWLREVLSYSAAYVTSERCKRCAIAKLLIVSLPCRCFQR